MRTAATPKAERGRPHERGGAQARSARPRVWMAADSQSSQVSRKCAEAAPQGAAPGDCLEADTRALRSPGKCNEAEA